jgi:hypothetical protein
LVFISTTLEAGLAKRIPPTAVTSPYLKTEASIEPRATILLKIACYGVIDQLIFVSVTLFEDIELVLPSKIIFPRDIFPEESSLKVVFLNSSSTLIKTPLLSAASGF